MDENGWSFLDIFFTNGGWGRKEDMMMPRRDGTVEKKNTIQHLRRSVVPFRILELYTRM